jgi:DNA-binding transcriptional MerR regulator
MTPEPGSDGDELMTAGRFSMATMLSAKALRLYAERGLLPARVVDPITGYRYYGADQIRTGWLIALLRSAELSLVEVAAIVGAPAQEATTLLERAVDAAQRRAVGIQAVLARARLHLRGEADMTALIIRTETDRPVLSVLRRMRPDEMAVVIPGYVDRLRAIAGAAALTVTGQPFGIFHAPITDESNGPLEITLPVDGLTELSDADGDVRSYRLGGGTVAERFAEGRETNFPEILALYDEVHTWITSSGRTPVGPPREIWHNGPTDSQPLRLTVSWPFASA